MVRCSQNKDSVGLFAPSCLEEALRCFVMDKWAGGDAGCEREALSAHTQKERERREGGREMGKPSSNTNDQQQTAHIALIL